MEATSGEGAIRPHLGLGRQALGQEQGVLGPAIAALQIADGGIATDGVELKFFGHRGQVYQLGGNGVEIGVRPTEADVDVLAAIGDGLYVLDLRFGRTAAVVANAEKAHGFSKLLRHGSQSSIDVLGVVDSTRGIRLGDTERRDAAAVGRLP